MDQEEPAERRRGVWTGGGVRTSSSRLCLYETAIEDMNLYFIFLRKLHLNFSTKEGRSTFSFVCLYGSSRHVLERDGVGVVDLQEMTPLDPHLADPTPECSLLPKPRGMVPTWARCYRRN